MSISLYGCFDNLVNSVQLQFVLISATGRLRILKDKCALTGLGGNICLARDAMQTVLL